MVEENEEDFKLHFVNTLTLPFPPSNMKTFVKKEDLIKFFPEDKRLIEMEWISVKKRKPTEKDSPILAVGRLYCFSMKALHYMDGWDGKGWYDADEEYGMGLNEDEAHFNPNGEMTYWMPLPMQPKE